MQLLRADVADVKQGDVTLKFQKLDPDARYALAAYKARVQPMRAVGEGKLLFPMVRDITPATGLGLPESASGRDLLNTGLTLRDDAKVVWIRYQKVRD